MKKNNNILIDHGSGGKKLNNLILETILPLFNNPILSKLNDSAVFNINNTRISFSTDSYVVDPIFFPGGNIGDLAINGTVNDISMVGAKPLFLSVGLILEEGFPMKDFQKILTSMAEAAKKADVLIVTGDTKVVSKGAADKIFINTSGIGIILGNTDIAGNMAKPGDNIIVSGSIADHGITILTLREGLEFKSSIKSDSAPLNHMVQEILDISSNIHVLRDPTRGGIGTTLNEIACQSHVGIKIYENKLPIKKEVSGICELLGFDPLYIANEGKLLCFVSPEDTDQVLDVIRKNEYGKDCCVIGEVTDDTPGKVFIETGIGGKRIVDMLMGEQLPRIC